MNEEPAHTLQRLAGRLDYQLHTVQHLARLAALDGDESAIHHSALANDLLSAIQTVEHLRRKHASDVAHTHALAPEGSHPHS